MVNKAIGLVALMAAIVAALGIGGYYSVSQQTDHNNTTAPVQNTTTVPINTTIPPVNTTIPTPPVSNSHHDCIVIVSHGQQVKLTVTDCAHISAAGPPNSIKTLTIS